MSKIAKNRKGGGAEKKIIETESQAMEEEITTGGWTRKELMKKEKEKEPTSKRDSGSGDGDPVPSCRSFVSCTAISSSFPSSASNGI